MTKVERVLQQYGLKTPHIRVYVACLMLGPSAVQKIALKAQLPRSSTYQILANLQQEGFIITFLKKKIKYFSAKDPDQVIRMAQSKVDALKDALPEFHALIGQAKNRPSVRFYQGHKEMKLILEEVLDEGDELLSFGSVDALLRELGDYYHGAHGFATRRAQKRIPVRAIISDSILARERQRLGPQQLREIRIVPPKYPLSGMSFIWKNKVALFSFANDFIAIVIESKELVDVQRGLFNYLWDQLSP